jgi:hypothetical protein
MFKKGEQDAERVEVSLDCYISSLSDAHCFFGTTHNITGLRFVSQRISLANPYPSYIPCSISSLGYSSPTSSSSGSLLRRSVQAIRNLFTQYLLAVLYSSQTSSVLQRTQVQPQKLRVSSSLPISRPRYHLHPTKMTETGKTKQTGMKENSESFGSAR